MYNDYRDQGYVPLAINLGQSVSIVKTYARQYTFPFLRDPSSVAWNLYNINNYIPLNYVLDTAQIVVGRMASWNETTIRGWITSSLTGLEESRPAVVTGLELSATPSPASRSAEVRYNVERAGNVTLRVFSTSGTLVHTLFKGSADGRSSVTWNLDDASGRHVPNGLYVCELSGAAGAVRTTVSVLR
jgi:hypothetical protein